MNKDLVIPDRIKSDK
jgi:hypothetical protein